MASYYLKEGTKLMFFEPEKPHFFKIILQNSILDGKLAIPKKFVKKYENNLPSSIVLKVPSGEKWRIELIKCDGNIWFKDGWQEFVKYYSVAVGSLLVFEYDKENYHFNVIIFDNTALEIDYPYNKGFQEPNIEEETETDTDVSVEILDDSSMSRKPREKPLLSFSQANKKMKVENSKTNGKVIQEGNGGSGTTKRKQRLTPKERANAIRRAKAKFKSENPFFVVAMQPSYIYPTCQLAIPAFFVRKYFKGDHGNAVLSNMDGQTWPVEYFYNVTLCVKASAGLRNGWRKFAKDNHLDVGDVCVFELIGLKKFKLQVTIFRLVEGNKRLGGEQGISRGNCFQESSIYPFFRVVISSSHIKQTCAVYVPPNFMISILGSSVKAKLQVENRWWNVKLVRCGKSGLLSAGWNAFAKENSLERGDVCVFELIDNEAVVIKVSIFRHGLVK